MAERPAQPGLRLPRVVWYLIYTALVVGSCCGVICLGFYLTFNWEYIRGDFAASQAQGRVERLYEQVRAIAPAETNLVWEEKPQRGTYAWGLSDGAERYAYAGAQQVYEATASFENILAAYQQQFSEWGWEASTPNNEIGMTGRVFQHPNEEHLLLGLCQLTLSAVPSEITHYAVFFDFDEDTRYSEGCQNRLNCLVQRYCEVNPDVSTAN